MLTAEAFIEEWALESVLTKNVLAAITDESLNYKATPGGRDIGRLACHIIKVIPEHFTNFGIIVAPVHNSSVVRTQSKEFVVAFADLHFRVLRSLNSQLTDAWMKEKQVAFGRSLTNSAILMLLVKHIIHHRGQLTVLLRQAGIKPPFVYGPPMEDWAKLGMEPPLI
jgi:uncharacterized damage-inducible protein DinB